MGDLVCKCVDLKTKHDESSIWCAILLARHWIKYSSWPTLEKIPKRRTHPNWVGSDKLSGWTSSTANNAAEKKRHPPLANFKVMAKLNWNNNDESSENTKVDELTEVGQLTLPALMLECLGDPPRGSCCHPPSPRASSFCPPSNLSQRSWCPVPAWPWWCCSWEEEEL